MVPASASIAMSLANLKGREQKPEAMIPYLKDTIRYASDLSTRRWATETLQETEKYLEEVRKADEKTASSVRRTKSRWPSTRRSTASRRKRRAA
jgi:hypothetical protein